MTTTRDHEPLMVPLGQLVSALAFLSLPYLLVGVLWADRHMTHLQYEHGPDKWASWVGEVIAWPVLIFVDVTLK